MTSREFSLRYRKQSEGAMLICYFASWSDSKRAMCGALIGVPETSRGGLLDAKILICALIVLSSQQPSQVKADNPLDKNSTNYDWRKNPFESERIHCLRISFSIQDSLKKAAGTSEHHELSERVKELFKNRSCICDLSVDKNGAITDLKMLKSSGLAEVDQYAMNLVKQADPIKSPRGDALRCVVYLPETLVRTYKDAVSPWQGVP